MKKITKIAITGLGVLAAFPTYAAEAVTVSPITASGDLDIVSVIGKVVDWILLLAGIVAVLFLILGGLQYITAAGNEKRVEGAKNTILYAVIGLIVILLAYVIVGFISQNVGHIVTS